MRPSRTPEVPLHRFSLAQWHQMIAAGILGEDDPLELLEGLVVSHERQTRAEAIALSCLSRRLVLALPDTHRVRPRGPLTLAPNSEPEPDLAVVRLVDEASAPHHPVTALLAVEVALSSLGLDRTVKARLYARASIPEFWIVNLQAHTGEVHRQPQARAGRYRSKQVYRRGQTVRCRVLPEIAVPVDVLFE
jgi:Uma2 family endonuclease